MKIPSFYPGPGRVNPRITEYFYEAYMEGVLSVNHRSEDFMELMQKTRLILHRKLGVPKDYTLAFVSSATESWEIIAQSLTLQTSQHFYSGAFGAKWYQTAGKLGINTLAVPFGINEYPPLEQVSTSADVICLTHCETSNGTILPASSLQGLRSVLPEQTLIALDVTSSLGGISIDFQWGDYWYASVQKCLGLPSGMGILILSPRAVARAYEIGETSHYNSLVTILENSEKNQTHYTPNVLAIYLLYRTLKASDGIEVIDEKTRKRFESWTRVIDSFRQLDWLVKDKNLRSPTVLALSCEDPKKIIQQARESDIILGNGYGEWKDSTFRIANFPAIRGKEIEKLIHFFEKNL
ncbi:MAG: aminotransferase class V-fold PLP-dependent enzyme [Cyclobacteriaceae bacterium]|nr:aminotransferase class V-fold PLP-dependent enzyme [Cyclobacteriaceae bacterium]